MPDKSWTSWSRRISRSSCPAVRDTEFVSDIEPRLGSLVHPSSGDWRDSDVCTIRNIRSHRRIGSAWNHHRSRNRDSIDENDNGRESLRWRPSVSRRVFHWWYSSSPIDRHTIVDHRPSPRVDREGTSTDVFEGVDMQHGNVEESPRGIAMVDLLGVPGQWRSCVVEIHHWENVLDVYH